METQTAQTTDSRLKEFFTDQLEDLLWAEKKLVKTLPKMQEAATSAELKDAFGTHLTETQNHVSRLEQIFSIIGEDVDTTKCAAMAGIVDEGEDIIDETEEGTAQRDVGLIFAGQKAEHYEIATYGGMVTLAKTLGYSDAADLLEQTLQEEKNADRLLTQIAENNINYQASTEAREEKGFFS
jgi:ferritin-like metal-binding protein YciE